MEMSRQLLNDSRTLGITIPYLEISEEVWIVCLVRIIGIVQKHHWVFPAVVLLRCSRADVLVSAVHTVEVGRSPPESRAI